MVTKGKDIKALRGIGGVEIAFGIRRNESRKIRHEYNGGELVDIWKFQRLYKPGLVRYTNQHHSEGWHASPA